MFCEQIDKQNLLLWSVKMSSFFFSKQNIRETYTHYTYIELNKENVSQLVFSKHFLYNIGLMYTVCALNAWDDQIRPTHFVTDETWTHNP